MSDRTCTIGGCTQPHQARGYCGKHYTRWRRHGDVNRVDPTFCASGAASTGWRGADAGYSGVHKRLRNQFGRAASHPCTDCGNRAAEWSYVGGCPNEKPSKHGPYSSDLTRYVPRCHSCHKRVDLARAR